MAKSGAGQAGNTGAGQRHQHGVTKNLVEGIGGVLAGAALVLLLRGIFHRPAPTSHSTATTGTSA